MEQRAQRGVELLANQLRDVENADQILHVGQVPSTSRCQFQFDQFIQMNDANAVTNLGNILWVRKWHGPRFTLAGKLAGDEKVDSDAGLGVPQILTFLEGSDVTAAF